VRQNGAIALIDNLEKSTM